MNIWIFCLQTPRFLDQSGFGPFGTAFFVISMIVFKRNVIETRSKVLTCWSLGGRFWYLEISNVVAATLCVPSSCNNVSVKTTVAQSFLRQVAPGLSQARFGSRQDFSKATELAHWSDFPLDFVIIGVDGCGSTALHRHLRRHTQVEFRSLPFLFDCFCAYEKAKTQHVMPYLEAPGAEMSASVRFAREDSRI